MNLRQAAEQALECLDYHWDNLDSDLEDTPYVLEAKQALRQALAQPEQEPVAAHQALEALDELESCARGDEPFNHFAAPLIRQFIEQALTQSVDLAKVGEIGVWGHKRQWVGLTDEEIQAERHKLDTTAGWTYDRFARAIEAKLKEKNG